MESLRREVAAVQGLRAELAAEQRESVLRGSGLSLAGQQVVRLGVVAGGDLSELLEAQQAAEVALLGNPVVRGNRALEAAGGLTQMRSEQDRAQEIMDWSVGLHAAPVPRPTCAACASCIWPSPATMPSRARWSRSRRSLPAATTATLPGLAANALNKVILQHFEAMSTWRWYEPLVGVVPHDGSTQDVQLIMMDGVANLSTVAEGNAYTELSVGDSKESLSFVKKGNYVGITLEMFRRSEIGKMQAIPRLMALASLRTRLGGHRRHLHYGGGRRPDAGGRQQGAVPCRSRQLEHGGLQRGGVGGDAQAHLEPGCAGRRQEARHVAHVCAGAD